MSSDMDALVGAAVALAVGIGIVRLSLRRRSDTPLSSRRFAVLAALQALAGALLFLTLFPPGVLKSGGVLVVATEGAPAAVAHEAGDILVAMPEAGPVAGARRAPDLATALRQHADIGAVRVVGHGLEARDRGISGRRLTFAPPPALVGLTDFHPPVPVPVGARFSVGGRVGAAPVRAELTDPSGSVVDRRLVDAGEHFVLSGHTRTEGLALFTLRLIAQGRTVDQIAVPVEARADPPARVLMLAGALGPETKYFRRWAEDVGVDLRLQADLGAGATLGDGAVGLTRDALAAVDLVIIDDRRWEQLSATQKAAISAAVDSGMGLLLRPEGPISAGVRQDWARLNMPLNGGGDIGPAMLSRADPGDEAELTRADLVADAPQTAVLARDSSGVALTAWRARGRGRVGVWTLTDSYSLVLSGRSSEHGELWSAMVSALSRPLRSIRPDIQAPAFAEASMSICGVEAGALVVHAETRQAPLVVDPAAGARACAAYWPDAAGWRLLRDGSGAETAFYVHPRRASSALSRAERRAATLALAAAPPARSAAADERGPGSPWPWFLAMLATLSALWWLERRILRPDAPARSLPL